LKGEFKMNGKWIVGCCIILVWGSVFTGCDIIPGGNEKTYIPTIGVILHDEKKDSAIKVVREGIVSKNDGKAKLEFEDSEGDQNTQNGQIKDFIEKNVDVIAVDLVNTNDTTTINGIITKTKEANIPLVFFLSGAGNQSAVYGIMADQNEVAALQGEIIADYWKATSGADRNGDGEMQYIMVHGPADHSDANIRKTKAIEAVVEAEITVKKLFEFDGAWGLDAAKKADMKTRLESPENQVVEAIFCGNDGIALGMIEVLKEIPYFADKNIPIVGIDGTEDAVKAVNEGKMLGTILQDFETIGKATFDICYALGIGESIPSSTEWSIDGKHVVVPSRKKIKE
jgi:methyl-galactoside transport system substrate-binding protein